MYVCTCICRHRIFRLPKEKAESYFRKLKHSAADKAPRPREFGTPSRRKYALANEEKDEDANGSMELPRSKQLSGNNTRGFQQRGKLPRARARSAGDLRVFHRFTDNLDAAGRGRVFPRDSRE